MDEQMLSIIYPESYNINENAELIHNIEQY